VSQVEFIHKFAYDHGRDPIDYAVEMVAMYIETSAGIRTARLAKPEAFPGFLLSLTDEATARRIVAVLMDAGWTPPEEAS
jgi:hypothetical protein